MSVNNLRSAKALPKLVATEPVKTYNISPEQFKFYEDNGYLVIKQFVDFLSLSTYKQRFVQICKGIVNKGNALVVREKTLIGKKLNPEDYINKIQEILYDDIFIMYGEDPKMLHVLSQFIGDDITAVNSMFINKPPGSGLHPPHQDLFYFPFRPAEKIIGSWTAIDHVTLENGCLFVVPGSHKAKILYPHGDSSKTASEINKYYHGILDESVAPLEKRVDLEMSPGDTVFLHPYLVHGSRPNVSKQYRKSITFHFANSHCHYVDLKGTVQEAISKDVEEITRKKGFHDITYSDVWKMKSKQVKGVRSQL